MKNRYTQLRVSILFIFLTLLFCWLFCGKYGVFGSKVDWISQHSVFPDYFRQQFYDTGDFFPEFALDIGGGQNIYHFAYYGLYSPVFWLSYLLPFVKMSDYLIAASFVCLTASIILFYCWLKKRGFSPIICFLTACLFLLAAPMIFQSYNQIMFVNYMPFLCMGLWGVDSFLEKGSSFLYILSVFFMILTSFYFSVGGILVLILYGMHRYFLLQDLSEEDLRLWRFFRDGIRFLYPILLAILLSAFFLMPTAMALTGGRGENRDTTLLSLLVPSIKLSAVLYHPYGIGLTTLAVTALLAGITWKRKGERILAWGLIFILTIPLFSYLLNGGLYIRDKVLIPFLPLFCYLIAYYIQKQQKEFRPFRHGILPYLLTAVLILIGDTSSMPKFSRVLLFLDAIFMMFCYLLFYKIHRLHTRGCKRFLQYTGILCLFIPALLFLSIYDYFFQTQAGYMLDVDFYQKITTHDTKKAIEFVDSNDTFCRMEQLGTNQEGFANLNRIQTIGQHSSSIYSSVYNEAYQKFRTETFELEEPYRNFLMQPASRNPVYQRFMGVKYLISQEEIPGYEKMGIVGNTKILQNDRVSPIAYATNRLLNQKTYETLGFPYNQTTLLDYAVIEEGGKQEKPTSDSLKITPGTLKFPKLRKDGNVLIQTKDAITADLQQPETVRLHLTELFPGKKNQDHREDILFLQFRIKNQNPSSDVSITLEKERNKLSARFHIYYNHNETFTYAVPLRKGQKDIALTLGTGDYQLSDLKIFLGSWASFNAENTLYQSEFQINRQTSSGDKIKGTVTTKSDGYFITTIPYDTHFEVLVDGRNISCEKVNTAFLGFPLNKGNHRIEISYHAPGANVGKLLSLLGILLCFLHLTSCFQHTKQTSRCI